MAKSVEQEIIAFFVGKGYTINQAAGIAGNVHQESSFNVNEPGGGLFQDIGGRGAGQGASKTAQLEKANEELNSSGIATKLKRTKSPEEAAYLFAEEFERPKKGPTENLAGREHYAFEAAQRAIESGEQGNTEGIPGESTIDKAGTYVVNQAKKTLSYTEDLAKVLVFLTERGSWIRVLKVGAGGIIFILAINELMKVGGSGEVARVAKPATGTVGKAGKAAAATPVGKVARSGGSVLDALDL